MGNKNNWDAEAMKGTLISDMEREVMDGISKAATDGQGEQQSIQTVAVSQQPSRQQPKEPTKGVQTYIPMSMYRRLNDIKLTRRENIAALVAQAIGLWLDVQEGKQKVSATI